LDVQGLVLKFSGRIINNSTPTYDLYKFQKLVLFSMSHRIGGGEVETDGGLETLSLRWEPEQKWNGSIFI
jgi:hypothetical protein